MAWTVMIYMLQSNMYQNIAELFTHFVLDYVISQYHTVMYYRYNLKRKKQEI